jgi:microcystin-dependent protein
MRDGSDIYKVPSGTYGVEDTTIESARYNAFVNDVAQDLNYPRPILAGGTGATNARAAILALGGEAARQVIANYDADLFEAGSFYSATTATGPPVSGHAFAGVIYKSDADNIIIEARDQNDANVPGRVYVREKKVGTWGPWKATGLTVIGTSEGVGNSTADMFFGLVGSSPNASFVVNSKADATGTNLLTVSKATSQITGQGVCPPGALMDFALLAAPAGWLACDGQAVSRTTYAALFAAVGTLWGAGDGTTTFNVPNMMSRFRRHRDNATLAGAVGTLKGPVNLAHTHTGSGNTGTISADHVHSFSGSTGTDSPDHTHSYNPSNAGSSPVTGGGDFGLPINNTSANTGGASARHTHAFSGSTSGVSSNHTHAYNFTTSGGSADDANEARPYSAAVLTCIKV